MRDHFGVVNGGKHGGSKCDRTQAENPGVRDDECQSEDEQVRQKARWQSSPA